MKKILILITLSLWAVFFSLGVYAQQTRHQIIRCTGPIPEDFLPKKIKSELLSDNAKRQTGREKRLFATFSVGNNYAIYNQLVSGYVVYGTPLNNYINKVADKLLANDKELRKKIRFYLFESAQVNAFAFSNGIVFINIGLVSHLENEAQLAFVMAHEIAHYKQEHSFKAYTHQKTLSRKERKSFEGSVIKEELNYKRFSRKQEQDADEVGFEIYRKSGYKLGAALGLLDRLAEAELPYDSLRLNKRFLDGTYLNIPEKYFIDGNVKAIYIDTTEVDSLRSHPAIPKRKKVLGDKIGNQVNSGEYFLVSEQEFFKYRLECRYELSRLYMLDKDYAKSIYNCYLLLSSDPNNEYLYEVLVKNLYFLQLNFNNSSKRDVVLAKSKATGETARIHFMLNNMKSEELNAWCLRKSWEYHTKFPDNEEIFSFTKKITQNFKSEFAPELSYFYPLNQYNDSLIQSFYAVTENEELDEKKRNNKGRKINKIKMVSKGSFAKYCMPDYLTQAHFQEVYQSLSITKKLEETDEDANDKNKKKKRNKQRQTDTPKLDINKIILADLTQISIDERRSESIMYNVMDKKSVTLINAIKICAEKNSMDVVFMVPEVIQKEDTSLLADRNIIIKYLDERRNYADVDELYGVDHSELKRLSEKYQTRYLGVVYNVGFVARKSLGDIGTDVCIGLLNLPLLPIALFEAFSPEKESYLGFALFDAITGKMVYSKEQTYNTGANTDLFKSEFYDVFLKLKSK